MNLNRPPERRGPRPGPRSGSLSLAPAERTHARTADAGRAARAGAIRERFEALAGRDALLNVGGLVAGYGAKEVLHGIDLKLGSGQFLCVIGPNGGGKSTLLHSIFGLADIRAGRVDIGPRNVTRLGPSAKLRDAGIACVLHDNSLFLDLTVEQNLWLGGYLSGRRPDARQATERVFDRHPGLAARRNDLAGALSNGERRFLEIARAVVTGPKLLLIDDPWTGLEPDVVERIFAMLRELKDSDRLSIVMAESNARRGLEVADIGCVLVAGEVARVGTGAELLDDPGVVQLFLGS